jgi:hypothetical protein
MRPMRPTRPLVALLLVCAMAIAGCGGTTIRHVTTTITRSSSSTPTTPTVVGETTAGSGSGGAAVAPQAQHKHRAALAGRSGQAILRAAAGALRRVHSYSMHAVLRQNGQRSVVNLAAASNHRYVASTKIGRSSFELIVLSHRVYLQANQRFWLNQSGHSKAARSRARRLADHWLALPGHSGRSLTHSLGTLAPGTLARCLTEDHGRLTVERGHTVIDNRRVIVVRDAGNAPGATPSTIAIAATGAPYPLRYIATGRTRRGGRVDVCNDGKGGGATGTITLGRFGSAPSIQPPSGAQTGPSVAA